MPFDNLYKQPFPRPTLHVSKQTDKENSHSFEAMQFINIATALALASTVCGAAVPASPLGEIEGSVLTLPFIGWIVQ